MGKSKYRCHCGATKVVPMDVADKEPSIRTGCEHCERITEHRPVGSVYSWGNGLARGDGDD